MSTEPLRAIDASVLLRYFLADDPVRSAKARALIESEQRLGLTPIALAETAWTLASRHAFDRASIARELVELLARENVVPLGFDRQEAMAILLTCARQTAPAQLGDALIAISARSAGVGEIYTFDAQFGRTGMTVIAPA
jgi:predicted nucleic acid-binding protein